MIERERRYKHLTVSKSAVLNLFNARAKGECWLPRFPDLPDDVEVVDVDRDFGSRNLCFLLYHPSWPLVADGLIPDLVEGGVGMTYDRFPLVEGGAVSVDHGRVVEPGCPLCRLTEKYLHKKPDDLPQGGYFVGPGPDPDRSVLGKALEEIMGKLMTRLESDDLVPADEPVVSHYCPKCGGSHPYNTPCPPKEA